jgi:serine protease Do
MVANGLALAIPSHAVEHFLKNREARPYLGIMTQPVLVRLGYQRILGLLVLAVTSNSPAESAGIYPFDILIKVGGQFFKTPNDLLGILGQIHPGDVLPLELIRKGQSYQMNVVVGGEKTQVEAA